MGADAQTHRLGAEPVAVLRPGQQHQGAKERQRAHGLPHLHHPRADPAQREQQPEVSHQGEDGGHHEHAHVLDALALSLCARTGRGVAARGTRAGRLSIEPRTRADASTHARTPTHTHTHARTQAHTSTCMRAHTGTATSYNCGCAQPHPRHCHDADARDHEQVKRRAANNGSCPQALALHRLAQLADLQCPPHMTW